MAEETKQNQFDELVDACKTGNIEAVQRILSEGNVNLNQVDIRGDTPLLIACQNGHTEIVSVLLDFGASVDQPTETNLGSNITETNIFKLFTQPCVEEDGGINVEAHWVRLARLLRAAIHNDLPELLKRLLEYYEEMGQQIPNIFENGDDDGDGDGDGDDGDAAVRRPDPTRHERLIGGTLTTQQQQQQQPPPPPEIHAMRIESLVTGGLPLLHYAIQQFKVSIFRKILMDTKPRLPFNMVEDILLNLYGRNIFNCSFGIILHHYRRYRISLDEQDANGNTALHTAANLGHELIVQQLLNAGADPTIKNTAGQTSQQIAEMRNARIKQVQVPDASTSMSHKELEQQQQQQQQGITSDQLRERQETLLEAARKNLKKDVTVAALREPSSPPPQQQQQQQPSSEIRALFEERRRQQQQQERWERTQNPPRRTESQEEYEERQQREARQRERESQRQPTRRGRRRVSSYLQQKLAL